MGFFICELLDPIILGRADTGFSHLPLMQTWTRKDPASVKNDLGLSENSENRGGEDV
jgi:hypothetical protein